MTSTTHFKPMTNNNTNVAKSSFVKQAATGVAFALAPFAIVVGIAAVNAPSAEAYSSSCSTSCYGSGSYRTCNTYCY